MPHDKDDEPVWVANWEATKKPAKKPVGGLSKKDLIIIGSVVGGVSAIIVIILGAVYGKRAADKRRAMGEATEGPKGQNAQVPRKVPRKVPQKTAKA